MIKCLMIVLTKTRNEPTPAKTSRNQPKRPPKSCKVTQIDTKFQNWGNLEFSTSLGFSNFEPKSKKEILLVHYFEGPDFKSDIVFWKFRAQMPKFRHFRSNSINFLILSAKFYMYPISNLLISNLTLVSKNVEPNSPNMGILCEKYQLSKLLISNLTFAFKNF